MNQKIKGNMKNNRKDFEVSFNDKDLEFNQIVLVSMIIPNVLGRLIQIRKRKGVAGTDIVLIRTKDGSLMHFENVTIKTVQEQAKQKYLEGWRDFGDSEDIEYGLSGGKYPERGFYIENAKQPKSTDDITFTVVVNENN